VPELPEVETIARDLEKSLRGARIDKVVVHKRDVLRDITAPAFSKRLAGVRFDRFWRRAKYAIADLSSGDRLVVSPKFTGALLVEPGPFRRSSADYTTVQFPLVDGRVLRYRDVRRLGKLMLLDAAAFTEWEKLIGPEPLESGLTDAQFADMVRSSRRAIKTILMDQRRIAGIGNIYANEALWRAKVLPSRPGNGITRKEAALILAEARFVLQTAVAQRGTSFRDYRDPSGGRGGFLSLANVYARAGQPCVRCGTTLESSHEIENRVTVWCPRCQQ
jgi:formamidopyrimidine-DNA glycosylase